jgi:hypothetical protein
MGKFLSFTGPLAIAAGLGLAATLRVIDQGAGHVTAAALAGGVFTIALAVYIRD